MNIVEGERTTKAIDEMRKRRDAAARNVILFTTETGRVGQYAAARAYNDALILLGVNDGSAEELVALEAADVKRYRGY